MSGESKPTLMQVVKYLPDKLYGFAEDARGLRVFFHLRVFQSPFRSPPKLPLCTNCFFGESCFWASGDPPPLLGEPVEVTVGEAGELKKAPPAILVIRKVAPQAVQGVVDTFDTSRGYGFAVGLDGVSYYLHRSEVLEGKIPIPKQPVIFYSGFREGRPRACHVKVCR